MHALLLALAVSWNADLTHLATELPKIHPDAFHSTTRESFLGEIETLRARAPEMQPHEVVVEMARIVATVGDGHTRLTLPLDAGYGFFQGHAKTEPLKNPALAFHALPIRFTILDSGLYTREGRQVLRIGRMTAADAIAAVSPVAHRDNEMQLREIVAAYLAVPEVLHARRVSDSLTEVPIVFADGTSTILHPEPPGVRPPAKTPWAFELLAQQKAVYFRYDEVTNTKDESLARFADRLFRFVDEQPADKLIIDLRDNFGGNGMLNRALVHGIIRSKKLQAPGSVYVLIGRRTFSAAVMFALDLERHTNAIFIGEPTGGRPNSHGDSRRLVLPESGITVRISTLYWQSSDPRDERPSIAPHVAVEPAFTGDPALATALNFSGEAASIAGRWSGTISIDFRRIPFTIVDGRITSRDLELDDVPLEKAKYAMALRPGTKRLTGTMSLDGREFLVVGERVKP